MFAVFDQQKLKEKDLKYFRGKLMQKLEVKTLKKNWKYQTGRLTHKTGSVRTLTQWAGSGLVCSVAQCATQAQREEA